MNEHGQVSQLFDKKFEFTSFNNIPEQVFKSPKWDLPIMQEKKIELNTVKSQLSNYNLETWSKHTRHNDPSSFVIKFLKQRVKPELLTQAWCKFYECLSQFEIIPNMSIMKNVNLYSSLHLCEAPGAFVSAFNHYVKSNYDQFNWDWTATTLNPDYPGNEVAEMITDDRLLRLTEDKWYFGLDLSGDITKYYNYLDLLKHIEHKQWLVTADGSIDCMSDPGNQENCVAYLNYCETITALSVLHENGTFVLKIFTMFEHHTISLLYLLNLSFRNVSAFKPCTSKGGNSEIYIICTGFKGMETINVIWESLLEPYKTGEFNRETSMFPIKDIPTEFLDEVIRCAEFFKNLQIETIRNNIENFGKKSSLHMSSVYHTKTRVAKFFMRKYRVKKIFPTCKLVPFKNVDDNRFEVYKSPLFRYHCDELVKDIGDGLDIKYGKKIDKVTFSKFCSNRHKEHLNVYRKKEESQFTLYKYLFMVTREEYLIINMNDFDCDLYSEFQSQFFDFFLINNFDRDIIFLNIPFLTNFFVGMLYLLCGLYEEISVSMRSIYLKGLKRSELPKFEHMLFTIRDAYDAIPKNLPFEADILEILPSNLLLYNDFYNLVFNYNDSLMGLNLS